MWPYCKTATRALLNWTSILLKEPILFSSALGRPSNLDPLPSAGVLRAPTDWCGRTTALSGRLCRSDDDTLAVTSSLVEGVSTLDDLERTAAACSTSASEWWLTEHTSVEDVVDTQTNHRLLSFQKILLECVK
ncbi:hypothetical protein Btru_063521 [Bulinus truncatus]|nr:hypothetical protein Btru_063521 [Bulinus truncatus]